MDTTVTLDGVDGSQLLGFLAAIGTLRVLNDQAPQLRPRLSWDYSAFDRPVLHITLPDTDGHTDSSAAGPTGVVLDQLDRYAHRILNGEFDPPPTGALPANGKGQVPVWPEPQPNRSWFEAVHHWGPWLTPSWNNDKDQAAFRMAVWAKNCGGKYPLPPIGVAQDAAKLLTLTPRKNNADPYPAAARWHDLLDGSPPRSPDGWRDTFQTMTGQTISASATKAFTKGYATWWLAPANDPGRHGIAGAEFSANPSQPSTKVKTICVPGHALLALPGLGSIPAHQGRMPGQDPAVRQDRTARWTLWAQPMSLPAVAALQWHTALGQPHSLAVEHLCGNYPSPVRAAELHEDSGTVPVPPPARTRR